MADQVKQFALVRAGKVENVILADDAFIAAHGAAIAGAGGAWVEIPDTQPGKAPGIGWTVDAAGKFAAPVGK